MFFFHDSLKKLWCNMVIFVTFIRIYPLGEHIECSFFHIMLVTFVLTSKIIGHIHTSLMYIHAN